MSGHGNCKSHLSIFVADVSLAVGVISFLGTLIAVWGKVGRKTEKSGEEAA